MLKEIKNLKTIKINGKLYCLSDELLVESPSTFSGCKTTRALINKKNLVEVDDYIFARLTDNEWVQSNGRGMKVDKVS